MPKIKTPSKLLIYFFGLYITLFSLPSNAHSILDFACNAAIKGNGLASYYLSKKLDHEPAEIGEFWLIISAIQGHPAANQILSNKKNINQKIYSKAVYCSFNYLNCFKKFMDEEEIQETEFFDEFNLKNINFGKPNYELAVEIYFLNKEIICSSKQFLEMITNTDTSQQPYDLKGEGNDEK